MGFISQLITGGPHLVEMMDSPMPASIAEDRLDVGWFSKPGFENIKQLSMEGMVGSIAGHVGRGPVGYGFTVWI